MTYSLSNYIKLGSASADTQKFQRVDSTQAIKKDITFTRKAATFNSKMNSYSVPEYRAIIRADVPDENANPSGQRLSTDIGFRLPVRATKAQLTEQIVTLRELVNSTDFEDKIIQQLFPEEGA